jgi:large subunit ribosomal protein L31e
MAKREIETKTEKIEREYVIPLREKCRSVPRYKKTNKAIKTIKEFLVKHMKIRDRDLKKIKLDKYLNEIIWFRGIKRPPTKIKVKAIKEGDIVKVELSELPKKLKFKKAREEKRDVEIVKKSKTPVSEQKKKDEEEKKDEKEKVKAGQEVGQQREKLAAKQIKHQTAEKAKKQTQPIRKALVK